MTSTTRLCLFCKKSGAKKNCGPCANADITISYCDRDCQTKDWRDHRNVCVHTTSKTKQSKSSDNFQEMILMCPACGKTNSSDTNHLVCSRCHNIHYCSKECQVNHWPKHKITCKVDLEDCEKAKQSGISDLFELWQQCYGQLGSIITHATCYALTDSQKKEQPPSFVIMMNLDFNYNMQTFMFTEEPRTVNLADLSDSAREVALQKIQAEEETKPSSPFDKKYWHYAIIKCKGIIHVQTVLLSWQKLMREGQWDRLVTASERITLESSLFESWPAPFQVNFRSQIDALHAMEEFKSFILYITHLLSTKPRHKTHTVIIHYKFGFDLGKISALASYEVVTIKASRKQFREGATFPTEADKKFMMDHMLDVENSSMLKKARTTNRNIVMVPVIYGCNPTHRTCVPIFVVNPGLGSDSTEHNDQMANECFQRVQSAALSLPDVVSPAGPISVEAKSETPPVELLRVPSKV